MHLVYKLLFAGFLLFPATINAESLDRNAVNEFIENMVANYQFDEAWLEKVFSDTKKSQRVLDAISRPAEALPWYKYRKIFLNQQRIDNGIIFWNENAELLDRAEKEFGVPPQIIVAIVGVETGYGANKGKDRVMDALSTLAFHYPKRGRFFRGELEHFLLLARDQKIDPLTLEGSYAGAMGMPQFIPSSYRNYAVDFDGDGKTDIWNNNADVIGSVGNYFRLHGWEPGMDIVVPATAINGNYTSAINSDLKPSLKTDRLADYGILPKLHIQPGTEVKVISLEGEEGEELWLGLNNFYVITRYNHSPLYAMAVYQLSTEIKNRRNQPVAVSGSRNIK